MKVAMRVAAAFFLSAPAIAHPQFSRGVPAAHSVRLGTPRSIYEIKPRASFDLSNGQEAQAANANFATLSATSACIDGEQACVGTKFAQCVGGTFQTTACADGTQCFSLPLKNKAGTTISCATAADTEARIAATGATGGITGSGSSANSTMTADNSTMTVDNSTMTADNSTMTAGNSTMTTDNSTMTTDNSTMTADKSTMAASSAICNGTIPSSIPPGRTAGKGISAGSSAKTPSTATSSNSSSSFQLSNGQEAQKLNAQFATLTSQSTCNNGEQACVGTSVAQCVGSTFQITACSSGTQCFALPLVNKAGTSVTCDTKADAAARIAATGAKGGITG